MTRQDLPASQPKYRPDIDGLRAIAVLAVVAYHAFPSTLGGGFTGVDVFFVISGFLISTIVFENVTRSTFRFIEFYARRVRRIFPALLLVLVACFLTGWHFMLAGEFKRLGAHIAGGAGFIANLVSWQEAGYFDKPMEVKPLLHLWSLGVEEQFYLIWPLLLWLSHRFRLNLLLVTILIAFASFCLNVSLIGEHPGEAFYSPMTRVWELMFGSIIAWLALKNGAKDAGAPEVRETCGGGCNSLGRRRVIGGVMQELLPVVGAVLLAYGFIWIDARHGFPGGWALIPVLGAVLIIVAGSRAWLNRCVLSCKPLVWVGLISYPLYLWHWPLLSFARLLGRGVPSVEVRLGLVGLAVLLAYLTYRFIERPVRFGSRRWEKTLALGWLLVAVFAAGDVTFLRDGFRERRINLINSAVNHALEYNWGVDYRLDTCFLSAKSESSNSFAPECGFSESSGRPSIVLWGDSHAAALYRGFLAESKRDGFEVAEYAAGGCPPILDFRVPERKECEHVNAFVLEQIRSNKPAAVVMAAFWPLYNEADGEKGALFRAEDLVETLRQVRETGVENIYLVGSVPAYTISQLEMLTRRHAEDTIETWTYKNFNPLVLPYDRKVSDAARLAKVSFISLIDLLCDKSGCPLSATAEPLTPLAWDYGHLTREGSEYVVSKIFGAKLISVKR